MKTQSLKTWRSDLGFYGAALLKPDQLFESLHAAKNPRQDWFMLIPWQLRLLWFVQSVSVACCGLIRAGGSRQQIRQCFSSEVSASSLLSWPSPPTSYFFIYNLCRQLLSPHKEKNTWFVQLCISCTDFSQQSKKHGGFSSWMSLPCGRLSSHPFRCKNCQRVWKISDWLSMPG